MFKPELAAMVMAGQKTQTRRVPSQNPRSPWYVKRCALRVGDTYAVCPGRGVRSIGRVLAESVTMTRLGAITPADALAEGFRSPDDFAEAWERINGSWDPGMLVWRVAFRVAS